MEIDNLPKSCYAKWVLIKQKNLVLNLINTCKPVDLILQTYILSISYEH